MNYLNLNIRFLRKDRKLSQKELADKLKRSESTIQMWESDKRSPTMEMVQKIADLFRVDIDPLVYTDLSKQSAEITEKDDKNPLEKWTSNYKFNNVLDALTYLDTFEREFGKIKAFGGVFYEEMTGKEIIEYAQEILRLQSMIANNKKD